MFTNNFSVGADSFIVYIFQHGEFKWEVGRLVEFYFGCISIHCSATYYYF